jgi:hypothetical protein
MLLHNINNGTIPMQRITILLLSYLLSLSALAIQPPAPSTHPADTILLTPYYKAHCADYTGTWQGFFTDPTDLYGNGNAWPITLHLYAAQDRVIGKIAAPNTPAANKHLWALCKAGILKDIFFAKNKTACGAFSQQGFLVGSNALVLQLHTENAMNGTDFWAFLHRIDRHPALATPPSVSAMAVAQVTTCH